MALDMEKFRVLNFPLNVVDVARLDRLAEKGGLTRAKLMQNFILAGIDFLETCEGWGVFAIKRVFEDMQGEIKKSGKFRYA